MIEDKFAKIKAKLVVEHPYFGSIATFQKTAPNENVRTYQVKDGVFEYNNDYINTLDDDEIGFLLTNSAMHQAFKYKDRALGRMDWLWTLSQDYAINGLLLGNGLNAPFEINYDEAFDMMSAEEIYEILKNDLEKDEKKQKEFQEKFEKLHENQNESEENEISQINDELLNKAKLFGDLPLGIELFVPQIFKGKINWIDELREVIEHNFKFDYQILPPNKRYLYQGVALPSLSGNILKLVVVIDSSGSIDERLLGEFLGEIESIMGSYDNYEIELIVADAKVQQHLTLYPGDSLMTNIKGGGGTNFENSFLYIEESLNEVSLLLYFTDGVGYFPKTQPSYSVIWVTQNSEIVFPFGERILI